EKSHIARAVLEATAYQCRDVFKAMEKDAGIKLASLKVDGGMTVNNLLMQFQSDVLDVKVIRPVINETTCLGAAFGAGLAVGFWKNQDELTKIWKEGSSWQPMMSTEKREHLTAGWEKAIRKATSI
ncbi:MAG: glycerol kinase, partial [Candidatus Cloacimonetes bacterium]|nr:glycerol kinase [Candidatus Cloacimonadota bacterium]